MKIHIKATGYYNSTNKRLCLLHEGDVLEPSSYDKEFDGWICQAPNNQTVWVEKENSLVLQ